MCVFAPLTTHSLTPHTLKHIRIAITAFACAHAQLLSITGARAHMRTSDRGLRARNRNKRRARACLPVLYHLRRTRGARARSIATHRRAGAYSP